MQDLVKALRSGTVLVMDGAMGTELMRLTHSDLPTGCEQLNRSDPDLVRSVHRAYLDAGADVLLTNTFQASRCLAAPSELHGIWQAAIRLAHVDHPRPRYILADVGPISSLTPRIAADTLAECVGVDGVLLETWSSLDDLKRFADVQRAASLPLLVSFTFQRTNDLVTIDGLTPEDCAHAAHRLGVNAIGANCGKEIGMDDMLEIVKRYRVKCDLPMFVRPNAGTPTKPGCFYPRSPEAMAAALPALLEAGVAMVGGCCGTTPEHVRQFRLVVDEWNCKK